MRAAEPERRSVLAGARRRAPRQTPGLHGVSVGSDAPVRGCAAGVGGGPGGQSVASEAPPSVPTSIRPPPIPTPHRPPRFGLSDLAQSKGGSVFPTAGRRPPLYNGPRSPSPSTFASLPRSSYPPGWSLCLSPAVSLSPPRPCTLLVKPEPHFRLRHSWEQPFFFCFDEFITSLYYY